MRVKIGSGAATLCKQDDEEAEDLGMLRTVRDLVG